MIVSLDYETDQIKLQICDSGIGFDARKNLSPPRGWGLAGMRERSEAVGGVFRLETSPGMGTNIEVSIPVNHNQTIEQSQNAIGSNTHQDEEI